MPEIRPFRGVRYDLARVGALSDVVAPPYDVIGPALQDTLYSASPFNTLSRRFSILTPVWTRSTTRRPAVRPRPGSDGGRRFFVPMVHMCHVHRRV